ncbi:denticleless protein homolog B-like [Actinia tenebrosa]|uniref:Denticleless protein homolog B-like n=1 Tax=Actinia tenebrosa TaxID=6105 RepID=A0A6P8IB68_ACTTE|nr:denticleless protein homolog B-like [Actinia tenebrosa]
MTLLSSILQRQLGSKQFKSRTPVDFAIKSFSCHRVDEHIVRGRDDEMEVPPFASQFSKSELGGHLLATADEDGSVKLFDTRKYGYRSIIREWTAHSNAIFDIAWMEGEAKLVTASGDQTALLWDVENGKCLSIFRGHSSSLKSANFRENDIFTFSTGSRDGNIMVWDIRCNRPVGDGFYKPVITIRNAHTVQINTPQRVKKRSRRASVAKPVADSQQSVTAVLFQDENKLISAGAMDGNIKIWDLRKNYSNLRCDPMPCHVFPYPGNEPRKHGFSSLVLDSHQSNLFASCTNDKIYMYDCTVLKENPVHLFNGHLNSTFYVKSALSPDNTYLLSGSSDNNAYIWRVDEPKAAPFVLKGHEGEVTSVAWCPVDLGKVVTCSDDNNIRIWRMNCNQVTRAETDFVGKCEQSEPRPCSPQQPMDICSPSHLCNTPLSSPAVSPAHLSSLCTPTRLNRGRQLNAFNSPGAMVHNGSTGVQASKTKFPFDKIPDKPEVTLAQGTPCKTKLIQPSSPCHTFPSTPLSPATTPGQRKQGSLRTWLKTTPKKTPKENILPNTPDGQKPSKLVKNERITPVKNKRLNNGVLPENESNEDMNGKSEEMNESECLSRLQECSTDDSPARKRQCITGPSSFSENNPRNNSLLNKGENNVECYIIDDDEKENIDTGNLNPITQGFEKVVDFSSVDKSIKRSDTWVIKWKNTELTCKKASGEADEQITCEDIPKLVTVGENILKYFKQIPSPAKES